MPAYSMTKAAALIATTKWAVLLAPEGFVVVAVSPGLVDTSDTVGEGGDPALKERFRQSEVNFRNGGMLVKMLTPKESAELQLGAIHALTKEQNGAFLEPTLV